MSILFYILIYYSFVFHWYPYFFPWASPDQPSGPLLIIISRDLLFILVLMAYSFKLATVDFRIGNLTCRPVWAVFLLYFLLFIFMMAGALHTNFSEFIQHNIRNMMMYMLIIPIFFHMVNNYDENITIKISKIFVGMGALLSLFGIYTFVFIDQELLWGGIRVYSLMGNPNTFGLFLIMPSLIAISLILQETSARLKIFMGGLVAINCIALIMTISFQSIFSFILAVCLMVFLIKGRKFILSFSVILVLLVILFYFVNEYYHVFIDFIFFKLEDPTSTSYTGRIEQFHYVMDQLMEIRNWPLGVFNLKEYMSFDNQYYNIFINNGLIAVLLYLMPPLLVLFLGLKFKRIVIFDEPPWFVGLYLSCIVFLIVTLLVTANLTAFMQRYPINLYYFLFLSIILHSVCKKLKIIKNRTFKSEGT